MSRCFDLNLPSSSLVSRRCCQCAGMFNINSLSHDYLFTTNGQSFSLSFEKSWSNGVSICVMTRIFWGKITEICSNASSNGLFETCRPYRALIRLYPLYNCDASPWDIVSPLDINRTESEYKVCF